MVRVLTFAFKTAISVVGRFNAMLRAAAAWAGWPLSIIILGCTGTFLRISDFVVYLLTVQTAIAASVADIAQRKSQDDDARRDARTDAMLKEIRKNGKMTIAAITAMNNLLTVIIERGMMHNGTRRPTPARRSRQTNRKK